MLYGVVTGESLGPWIRQVVGAGDCPVQMGDFGVDMGHPIVTNWDFVV